MLLARIRRDEVRGAVSLLPWRERVVVRLLFDEDGPGYVGGVVEKTGWSEEEVERLRESALKQLRGKLQEWRHGIRWGWEWDKEELWDD